MFPLPFYLLHSESLSCTKKVIFNLLIFQHHHCPAWQRNRVHFWPNSIRSKGHNWKIEKNYPFCYDTRTIRMCLCPAIKFCSYSVVCFHASTQKAPASGPHDPMPVSQHDVQRALTRAIHVERFLYRA